MTLPLCREKAQIAAAFSRAAPRYDAIANYQQASGKQLLSQLEIELAKCQPIYPLKILDAGCGTGFFSQIMQVRGDEITALDLSSGMLDVARNKKTAAHYVCADMGSLPFASQTFDVVFSNLALQWCQDFAWTLSELYRVTKPGGVIAFTTLAKNSLSELTNAWQTLDNSSHVNTFLAYPDIIQSCREWRNQLNLQQDTLYFSDLNLLLHSLKGIGATHLSAGRKKGLMTRQRLQQLAWIYPKANQGMPLTYHTVFGIIYRD